MNKLIALAIVAGLAPMAFADGNQATTSAQASVQILCPVTATTDGVLMNFGKVIVPSLPADVVMGSTGAVTAGGNASIYVHPGTTTVPHFSLTKDSNVTAQVVFNPVFPNATFTIDNAVLSAVTTFQGIGQSALTNQALFGRLDWTAVPTAGAITGSIGIAVSYN
jgi:hypothetical protein